MGSKLFKLIGIIVIVLTPSIDMGNAATWTVGFGGDNWDENITHDNTTEVRATSYVELRQLVDDYVSYWRFDEGSGIVLHDENKTSLNDGTLGDNADWNTGRYGKGIDMNRTVGSYGKVPDNDTLEVSEEMSISAWIYPRTDLDTLDTSSTIVAKMYALHQDVGYELYVNRWADQCLWLGIGNGTNSAYLESSGLSWEANQWYHTVVCFNLTFAEFYRDGKFIGDANSSLSGSIAPSNMELGFGVHSNCDVGQFDGIIDEVYIFDRRLTKTEINNLYNNSHYGKGTLISIVKDAESLGSIADIWKQISLNIAIPTNTNVNVYIRTSFDNGASDPWTDWTLIQANATSGITYDLPVKNRERYGQWKLELETSDASLTPEIQSVSFISGSITDTKEGKKISVGPNPFTPGYPPYDKVVFVVDNPGNKNVTLQMYNLESRLVFKRDFSPTETIYWDGRNSSGRNLQDGIYIYQVKIGSKAYNGKVVLAR